MKISKKNKVNASANPIGQELPQAGSFAPAQQEVLGSACKYENAINLISAAIESLAEIARDDEIAKDSIANLGVVMLDLKGSC